MDGMEGDNAKDDTRELLQNDSSPPASEPEGVKRCDAVDDSAHSAYSDDFISTFNCDGLMQMLKGTELEDFVASPALPQITEDTPEPPKTPPPKRSVSVADLKRHAERLERKQKETQDAHELGKKALGRMIKDLEGGSKVSVDLPNTDENELISPEIRKQFAQQCGDLPSPPEFPSIERQRQPKKQPRILTGKEKAILEQLKLMDALKTQRILFQSQILARAAEVKQLRKDKDVLYSKLLSERKRCSILVQVQREQIEERDEEIACLRKRIKEFEFILAWKAKYHGTPNSKRK